MIEISMYTGFQRPFLDSSYHGNHIIHGGFLNQKATISEVGYLQVHIPLTRDLQTSSTYANLGTCCEYLVCQ